MDFSRTEGNQTRHLSYVRATATSSSPPFPPKCSNAPELISLTHPLEPHQRCILSFLAQIQSDFGHHTIDIHVKLGPKTHLNLVRRLRQCRVRQPKVPGRVFQCGFDLGLDPGLPRRNQLAVVVTTTTTAALLAILTAIALEADKDVAVGNVPILARVLRQWQ